MRILALRGLAIGLAVAILSGCGTQSGANALPQGVTTQSRAHQASGSSGDLLYVADTGTDYSDAYVLVYSYPQGKLVETLTGFHHLLGECSDSQGNVFVIAPGEEFSNPTTVYEFAHGGSSPIATLSETGEGFGCAVDPKTGNLAVANSNDINNPDGKDYGDVAIFAGATGSPTMYYSSKFLAFYHCGYDNSGNLYVSGWESISSGYEFALASINAGSSSSIEPVTLNKKLYGNTNLIPGVQWDGKEMTVSSLTGLVSVYRLRISGQKATVTGTTTLRNPQKRQRGETYIQGNTITGVYYYHGRPYISFWPYPKGGKPSRVIRQKQWPSGSTLYGVTISVAPSRSRIHR